MHRARVNERWTLVPNDRSERRGYRLIAIVAASRRVEAQRDLPHAARQRGHFERPKFRRDPTEEDLEPCIDERLKEAPVVRGVTKPHIEDGRPAQSASIAS